MVTPGSGEGLETGPQGTSPRRYLSRPAGANVAALKLTASRGVLTVTPKSRSVI
jgi:hypothetical protein